MSYYITCTRRIARRLCTTDWEARTTNQRLMQSATSLLQDFETKSQDVSEIMESRSDKTWHSTLIPSNRQAKILTDANSHIEQPPQRVLSDLSQLRYEDQLLSRTDILNWIGSSVSVRCECNGCKCSKARRIGQRGHQLPDRVASSRCLTASCACTAMFHLQDARSSFCIYCNGCAVPAQMYILRRSLYHEDPSLFF